MLATTSCAPGSSPQQCLPAAQQCVVPRAHSCPLIGGGDGGQGARPSYAAVLKQPPKPKPPPRPGGGPPGTALGRPAVQLPLSQLTLGRTTAPWQGSAWNVRTARVLGDLLRVDYQRGSGTQRGDPPGGVNFKARPHCLPAADLTFRYKVRFAANFDWSRGGKLPGIFVGSGDASGGEHSAGGASVRVMWQRDGRLAAYVYVPAGVRQPAAYRATARAAGRGYGDLLFEDAGFAARGGGAGWNDVILRVKLNSFDDEGAPRPDGVLTMSVNGQPASLTGVIWRRRPEVRISHLAIVSFYGGKWKCPRTTYAEFTGFACVA
jgi:hypothetical protein